jgi:hypothetical protein
MPHTIKAANGKTAAVKTFEDGSPELRATLLLKDANGKDKRIDLHFFELDQIPALVATVSESDFLALFAADQYHNGQKVEIGPGNIGDLKPGQPGPAALAPAKTSAESSAKPAFNRNAAYLKK